MKAELSLIGEKSYSQELMEQTITILGAEYYHFHFPDSLQKSKKAGNINQC